MGDRSLRIWNQMANMDKPLNSINLDELLKNAIPVEGGEQVVQNPSSSSSSSPSTGLRNLVMTKGTTNRKTMDEIWRDIVHQEQAGINGSIQTGSHQQFGETTLENFLAHAGVINQNGIRDNYHQLTGIDSTALKSHQMMVMDTDLHATESVHKDSSRSIHLQAAASSDRKRHCSDEMMEKTIERRQKRMIKNRESAARSRARKQAYTNQLELEVKQLRERNSWLKKQKEMAMKLQSDSTTEVKYQLRRASSTPF